MQLFLYTKRQIIYLDCPSAKIFIKTNKIKNMIMRKDSPSVEIPKHLKFVISSN